MKLVNCYALAQDGTYFTTQENLQHWKVTNPVAFSISLGQQVQVLNRRLLSAGTKGVVSGFDRTPNGTILVLVKWNKDAAPLRLKIQHLMPSPPDKFWMVIPYNEASRAQSNVYAGDSRRNGTAPAVHRFPTRQLALDYITQERRSAGYNDFIILEPTSYHTLAAVVPM